MNQHPLTKKSSILVLGFMMASVSADNLTKWGDPYCTQWNSDGSQCLECSYHYYRDANCVCQPVSDFCKTWDSNTGDCTSCFPSYGDPVNGKCSNTPVSNGGGDTVGGGTDTPDDHCASYGYLDANFNLSKIYKDNCKKVCSSCDEGYFLTDSYKCLQLPEYCIAVNDYGSCTVCQNGYTLNAKTGACQETVVSVPDDKPCDKDDHKDCKDKDCKDDKDSVKKDNDSKSCEEDSKSSDKQSQSTKEDCESSKEDSVSKNDDSQSKGEDCDQIDSDDVQDILDGVKKWFDKNGKDFGKEWKIQLKTKDDKWEDVSKGKDCDDSNNSDHDHKDCKARKGKKNKHNKKQGGCKEHK